MAIMMLMEIKMMGMTDNSRNNSDNWMKKNRNKNNTSNNNTILKIIKMYITLKLDE